MGFTRYWSIKSDLPTSTFRKAASDIRRMLKSEGAWMYIVRWEADSKKVPLCNVNGVRFNGINEDGHETFGFCPFETEFDFCKTAGKDYDVYVHASLLIIKAYFPDLVDIDSDDAGDEDSIAERMAKHYKSN